MENKQNTENHIAIFKGKSIRKTIFQKEWWFSVVDVCGVLTDSPDHGAYWRKLKQRLTKEGSEVVTILSRVEIRGSRRQNARVGGQIAGSARKQIERKLGRSVISEKNFLKSNNRKKIKN